MEASRFSTPSNVRSPLRGGVMASSTGSFFRWPPSRMFLMLILMISASLSWKWSRCGTAGWRSRGPSPPTECGKGEAKIQCLIGADAGVPPYREWERRGRM